MTPQVSKPKVDTSTVRDTLPSIPVTREEIYRDGRALGFTENAIRVIEKRYLVRDEEGRTVETPKGMFRRIARALAVVEADYGANEAQVKFWEEQFYTVLSHFEFTPAGRTITNAGGPTRVVANCIVLHMEDSMDGIFGTLRDATLLQQAGSGLGFPWHLLRPAGTIAVKSRGVASGPVPFLRSYDAAFGVVKQQGRHGANMGVMRVDHPDILEFIDCKRKEGEIVNFNVSLGLTDEFMTAVKTNDSRPWMCEWKGQKMKPHAITRNNRGAYKSHEDVTITARELMDRIVDAAWSNGEPGVLFPDAANRTNPVPALGRLEATNPCGEQWLHDSDVCNLGSLNLARFVNNGAIDEDRLRVVSRIATRMLDNVIDMTNFPVDRVNKRFRDNRRVGLGIMGFADMLYQLGIPYNAPEGLAAAEQVMKIVNDAAHQESEDAAGQKGVFPNWEISIFGPKGTNRKQRNAALTTVAPTGSISMFFDCSSGVEPFFALAYYKEVMGGDQLPYFNSYLEAELRKRNLYSDELLQDVLKTGTIQHRTDLPEDLRRTFVTAMDISAEDHIRMQAAFQKHVDNSISKTINFKNSATRDDVRNGYILAWELGCKGGTVYRDGSRNEQVLNLNSKKSGEAGPGSAGGEKVAIAAAPVAAAPAPAEAASTVHANVGAVGLTPRPRPDVTHGSTYKIKTGYGNLYVTINDDEDGRPFEVFATIGKTGGVFAAKSEAICRLASIALRSGIDPAELVKELKGIRGPMPVWGKNGMVLSIPDAIAQVMEEHVKRDQQQFVLFAKQPGDAVPATAPVEALAATTTSTATFASKPQSIADLGFAPQCPDCSGILEMSEGCMKCRSCGFSKCG
ncbi:adenosylcobalamin-dependent ribonucleoside-diphosphate reductase [Candidatus Uhrbacteria bacterium]|nr:adenosylcobalamin-dependent ribonucleoside-diphosphate reductase [Candidatus Uhrbacteria bacterium]